MASYRAGDIRDVSVVVCSHIQQSHVRVLKHTVVRRSGVTIMQHGVVGAACTDVGIGALASTTVLVYLKQEAGLELILHHTGLGRSHHSDVRITRNISRIVHHCNLCLRLGNASSRQNVVERAVIERSIEFQGGVSLVHTQAGVAVGPAECVDASPRALRRDSTRKEGINFIRKDYWIADYH